MVIASELDEVPSSRCDLEGCAGPARQRTCLVGFGIDDSSVPLDLKLVGALERDEVERERKRENRVKKIRWDARNSQNESRDDLHYTAHTKIGACTSSLPRLR